MYDSIGLNRMDNFSERFPVSNICLVKMIIIITGNRRNIVEISRIGKTINIVNDKF